MLKHNDIKSNIFTNQNKFFDKNKFLYFVCNIIIHRFFYAFSGGAKYVS